MEGSVPAVSGNPFVPGTLCGPCRPGRTLQPSGPCPLPCPPARRPGPEASRAVLSRVPAASPGPFPQDTAARGPQPGLPPLSPRRGRSDGAARPPPPRGAGPALPAAAARPAVHLGAWGLPPPPPPPLGPGPAARRPADPGEAVRAAGGPAPRTRRRRRRRGEGRGAGRAGAPTGGAAAAAPGGRAEGGARRGVGRRKREPGPRVRAGGGASATDGRAGRGGRRASARARGRRPQPHKGRGWGRRRGARAWERRRPGPRSARRRAAMAGYVPGQQPANRSQEKEFVQAYEDVLERYKGAAGGRAGRAGVRTGPGWPGVRVRGRRAVAPEPLQVGGRAGRAHPGAGGGPARRCLGPVYLQKWGDPLHPLLRTAAPPRARYPGTVIWPGWKAAIRGARRLRGVAEAGRGGPGAAVPRPARGSLVRLGPLRAPEGPAPLLSSRTPGDRGAAEAARPRVSLGPVPVSVQFRWQASSHPPLPGALGLTVAGGYCFLFSEIKIYRGARISAPGGSLLSSAASERLV